MNSVTRFNAPPPMVGTQSGQWVWNGTSWQCDSGFDDSGFPGCPPSSFPPGGCPPWFPPPQGQPPWYPGANAGVSFSATAPVNPVRGHFWWNGTTLAMFDGAAWVTVGGSQGTPASATPPANPFPGQQWFNGTTLFVWDGAAWVPVSQTKSTISPTAPPSPSPGDTWWDGTQMRIWDGTSWELVGPGATVGPVGTTTKAFSLTQTGDVTVGAANTWAIVPFLATPSVDLYNGWNPGSHQFKPTKAGYYQFFTNQDFPNGAVNMYHALLLNDNGTWNQNGQNYITFDGYGSGTTAGVLLTASGIAHFNGTTDFARLWAYTSDGIFYQFSTSQPAISAFILP
jgi:hypothetical protein